MMNISFRLATEADLPVIFDAPYFGTKREKIFTSPLVFTPGRAFVTRNKTRQITGYIFAQPRMLGPWVASTTNDAETLLLRALSLLFEGGPTVSIPTTNEAGIQLLRRNHFSQFSINHYMIRGAPVQIQRAMIYAQASPALG
jgi:Acetyltransferase (GNAT) domain